MSMVVCVHALGYNSAGAVIPANPLKADWATADAAESWGTAG